jgi:hypothetical protein
MLIVSGVLTRAHGTNGKNIALPQTFNSSTGKDSMRHSGFNYTAWGSPTCSYTRLAHNLIKQKFDTIVQETQPYINLKPSRMRAKRQMG